MLETSIVFYSHHVFYPSKSKLQFFTHAFCPLQMLSIWTSLKKLSSGKKRKGSPLPENKILDQTNLKAFADDKLNVTKVIISIFDRVGKGEIACPSNFSFFHNVFKRLLTQTHQKVSLCWNGLMHIVRTFHSSNSVHCLGLVKT